MPDQRYDVSAKTVWIGTAPAQREGREGREGEGGKSRSPENREAFLVVSAYELSASLSLGERLPIYTYIYVSTYILRE